ncbi:hypothetical protein GZH53_06145 [Flavihumibacter sp. R14]|nr:hypothetical protein [Flavihumibacter soli]
MQSFEIDVCLSGERFTLSVVPYEYPSDSRNTAFELISEKVWVGSVRINDNYAWEGFAGLRWKGEDVLKIGYEITSHYL